MSNTHILHLCGLACLVVGLVSYKAGQGTLVALDTPEMGLALTILVVCVVVGLVCKILLEEIG